MWFDMLPLLAVGRWMESMLILVCSTITYCPCRYESNEEQRLHESFCGKALNKDTEDCTHDCEPLLWSTPDRIFLRRSRLLCLEPRSSEAE